MDNFNFYSPTEFVFGKDRENECGKYVKKYGGTKVLIHYGGGSAVRSGLLDRVKSSLAAENIPFAELGGVQPNPIDTKVYEGIGLCRAEGVDFILAVGGGSVIDSSKAIAVGALYDGDFWDFYDDKATVEKALPVGTVLTIAAAGSEGSGNTVITKTDGMWKRGAGGDALRPKFSVMNPELTYTLPAYQTACGATDIMAHNAFGAVLGEAFVKFEVAVLGSVAVDFHGCFGVVLHVLGNHFNVGLLVGGNLRGTDAVEHIADALESVGSVGLGDKINS